MLDLELQIFLHDLDNDILTLGYLIEEFRFAKEEFDEERYTNPEEYMEMEEQYYLTRDEYLRHRDHMLIQMEKWFQLVRENKLPINIQNYRILQELRSQ